jgi:hypothetical protein
VERKVIPCVGRHVETRALTSGVYHVQTNENDCESLSGASQLRLVVPTVVWHG